MKYFISVLLIIFLTFITTGCGGSDPSSGVATPPPPVSSPVDNAVVRGSAQVTVGMSNSFSLFDLLISKVYAAAGSGSVSYSNAASVTFNINTSQFAAAGFTGDTLNLGSIALSALSDNNLNVCGLNGHTKCTQAVIRVYTTGSVAGFVNTSDGTYGAPVYAGTLNPNSPVGLGSANSVYVQTYTIPANHNKVTLANFPTPSYNVTSDFSNAGSGTYQMIVIMEYILI